MRNALLIAKREYLERVRTKSFIISTLLLPAFMIGVMVLPTKMATMKAGTRRIAVVSANADFGQAVRSQLETTQPERMQNQARYKVEIVSTPDEATRESLRAKVTAGQLDGYVWLSDEALRTRKITYVGRETSDFVEMAALRAALKTSLLRQALLQQGVSGDSADALMKDVDLEASSVKQGQEKRAAGPMQFIAAIVLVMMLYMALLLYGVAVMRSVLEEKSSRVVEVLLSSVTAKELMAGKVLGVGAVGLTQIGLWVVLAAVVSAPGVLAAGTAVKGLDLGLPAIIAFGVFFALGYTLYSALYAALGAMVNSEQEAQQWQFFIMMPVIIPIVMMSFVLRQPNAPLSVWMSLVPFFTPILMYMRIIVQMPPWWQIALSIVLMVLTIWGTIALCSRIYRVGVLMYGKKPTLPEILKWVRYA